MTFKTLLIPRKLDVQGVSEATNQNERARTQRL